MLGVTTLGDAFYHESKQFINLYAPVTPSQKFENAVADLIALAADKGMRGHHLDMLINKIDDIRLLMDMYGN